MLPRAFCAGLIEALHDFFHDRIPKPGYPVLFARASLKQPAVEIMLTDGTSYPVLFARASLKHRSRPGVHLLSQRYPVLFARASLKQAVPRMRLSKSANVTPCFLRGPH